MEVHEEEYQQDIDFHPSSQLLATGFSTGKLAIFRYGEDSTLETVLKVQPHGKPCRTLRFINDGKTIVSGSRDCSIVATDVETGANVVRLEHAHVKAVSRIIKLTESTIASGDDGGCVKIWDARQRSCSGSFSVHEDYISDMTFAADFMKLVATSGDGTLSVCNMRTNKVSNHSECYEEDLLSVVIMKNGRKVVCGTLGGTLLLYSWGFFKDCSDRFVDLCSNTVDVLLKYDEDRVITGCGDGLIRLVGILPNRIIQPIAEHSTNFPVERLAFSHDKKFLGSISHDGTFKLWNLDELLQASDDSSNGHLADGDSDNDGMDVDASQPKSFKGGKTKRKNVARSSSSSFFADM